MRPRLERPSMAAATAPPSTSPQARMGLLAPERPERPSVVCTTPRSKRSRRSTLRRLIMLVSIRCSAETMTVLGSLDWLLPVRILGQPTGAAAEVVHEIFSIEVAFLMTEARGANIRWAVVVDFIEPKGCDGMLGTADRSVSTA
ncbi:hypothetical protein Vafri_6602 [Volvox africanus]|uniref:Uncharacterized protein n=1 Tax=Volvox africanus TaxID=51714 RepID=A0A8J4AYE8_9CHLO|nr:hypothetical protein Vafri_6602 [Volvox africanus]